MSEITDQSLKLYHDESYIHNDEYTFVNDLRNYKSDEEVLRLYSTAFPAEKPLLDDIRRKYGNAQAMRLLMKSLEPEPERQIAEPTTGIGAAPGQLTTTPPTTTAPQEPELREGAAERKEIAQFSYGKDVEMPELAPKLSYWDKLRMAETYQRHADAKAGEAIWGVVDKVDKKRQALLKSGIVSTRKVGGNMPDLDDFVDLIEGYPDVKTPDQPGLNIGDKMLAALQVPTPIKYKGYSLPFGGFEQNRKTLQSLMINGRVPTRAALAERYGDEYADQLMIKMRKLSPQLVSPDANWYWRGETKHFLSTETLLKHPYIGNALDSGATALIDFVLDEATDPKEWVLDYAIGKFFVVPVIKFAGRHGLKKLGFHEARLLTQKILSKDARRVRKALGAGLEDVGVSKAVIKQLDNLGDDQLRGLSELARKGEKINFHIPDEAIEFPNKANWEDVPDWQGVGKYIDEDLDVRVGQPAQPKGAVHQPIDEAGVDSIAVQTGQSRDDVIFLRSQGLSDEEIIERAAKELVPEDIAATPINVGDTVTIRRWRTDGTVKEITRDGKYVVQTPVGRIVLDLDEIHIKIPEEYKADIPTTGQQIDPSQHQIGDKVSIRTPDGAVRAGTVGETHGDLMVVDTPYGRFTVPNKKTGSKPIVYDGEGKVVEDLGKKPNGKTTVMDEQGKIKDVPDNDLTPVPDEQQTTLDEINAKNRREYRARKKARKKEQSEGGFLRTKKRAPGEKSPRTITSEVVKKHTGSTQYLDDLYASRDQNTRLRQITDWSYKVYDTVREAVLARLNQNLIDVAYSGQYNEALSTKFRQFAEDWRIGPVAYGHAADTKMHLDLQHIWGDLDADAQDMLNNLFGTASNAARAKDGLPIMSGITADQATAIFDDLYAAATPEVQRAFESYSEWMRAFTLEHLIKRGLLDPDKAFDFYMPHQILAYMSNGRLGKWRMPRALRKKFRTYLIEATGSEKPFAAELEAIQNYVSMVYADNWLDDFGFSQLKSWDKITRESLDQQYGAGTVDKALSHIKGGLKHNTPVQIGDNIYVGYQFTPGNYMFEGVAANPDLVALAIEDALLSADTAEQFLNSISHLPVEQQYQKLLEFTKNIGANGGDALRKALMVGRRKPVYLLPVEVAQRFNKFKEPDEYIPLITEAMNITTWWKRWTLRMAGFKYFFNNLTGDGVTTALTDPGSIKFVPEAIKLATAYGSLSDLPRMADGTIDFSKPFKLKFRKGSMDLSANQLKMLQELEDFRVIDSGFMREVADLTRQTGIHPFKTWDRANAHRESWMRIALYLHQLDLIERTGRTEAIQFQKILKYLTPKQQAAFIARNTNIDYADLPKWYKKYARGFLFPFITFAHKNTLQTGNLLLKMPVQRPLRFGVAVASPLIASYTLNHMTQERDKVYNKLGPYRRNLLTTIINYRDVDGDGEPDKAWVFSPTTSVDELAEWIGMEDLMRAVEDYKRGVPLEEAAGRYADTLLGTGARQFGTIVNPMGQIIIGIAGNKDPYTGRKVIDPEMEHLSDFSKYYEYAQYAAEKMITSYGQFSDTSFTGKGKALGGPQWGPEILRRVGGTLYHGTFNLLRGLGFHEVDLNANVRYEIQRTKTILENQEKQVFRKFVNDYGEGSLDPMTYLQQVTSDLAAFAQDPGADLKTGGGIAITDAHRKWGLFAPVGAAIDPDADLTKIPMDYNALYKRLEAKLGELTPHISKIDYALRMRREPFKVDAEGKPVDLTKATEEEWRIKLDKLKKLRTLEEATTATLATRARTLQQVQKIIGYQGRTMGVFE